MTTAELVRHEIDVTDVEYIRHGARPYLARDAIEKIIEFVHRELD